MVINGNTNFLIPSKYLAMLYNSK